jgi:hypothetical protein
MLCGKPFPGFDSRDALDWRWYHGWLDRTVHFCLSCRTKPQADYLFERSRASHSPGAPRINADLALALYGAKARKYTPREEVVVVPDPGERERAAQYASLFAWEPGETRGEYRRTSFAATCGDERA